MIPHPDWILPDWPSTPGVHAVFTTRAGGVSEAPFDSLNLGDHVNDATASVAANRASLRQALGVRPVYLKQVHGTVAQQVEVGTPDGTVADAAVTAQRAVACTVMVADCLPVLFAHESGAVVAAAHAGWRGLQQGVLEHTFAQFRETFRALALVEYVAEATDLIALAKSTRVWLGPCIGPKAFEVGPEVREVFVSQDPASIGLFVPAAHEGKWLSDLPGLARLRLTALGFTQIYGNDGSDGWCTVGNASQFFSHRRDSVALGGTGRMAACIWRL